VRLKEQVEAVLEAAWAQHRQTCGWSDKGQPLVEETTGRQVHVRWTSSVDGRTVKLVRQGHVARVCVLILEAGGFRVGKIATDDRGTYWTVSAR
jgi:hypothetical protein